MTKIALTILLYFGHSTTPAHIDGGQFASMAECKAAAAHAQETIDQEVRLKVEGGVSSGTTTCK